MSQSATGTQSPPQNLANSPAFSATVSFVGKILLAAIFIVSGVGKIAAPAGTIEYIAAAG